MNNDRILELAGLKEADYSKVTPYETTSTELTAEQKAAVESNNKDTKNKSIDEVSDEKVKVETRPSNKPKAIEINKATPKSFNYKIEMGANGAAKVANTSVVETITTKAWSESPDYHSQLYVVKGEDEQFVVEATDELINLGESKEAVLFTNLDTALMIASVVNGEVYESQLIDPMVSIIESAIAQEFELTEAPLEPADNAPAPVNGQDNIQRDIQSRVEMGRRVMISVNYQGQMFTGDIKSTAPAGIMVEPTPETVKRYNISNPKQVLLPVDYKSLQWSPKYNNVIVGHAKDAVADMAKPSPDAGRTTFNSNSGAKPAMGNPADPSTFQVDYSSFKGPEGDNLSESEAKPKKLIEYIAKSLGDESSSLQKKLKGLKAELKAALADEDEELADDIRSDIRDVERKIAKSTAMSSDCKTDC